MATMINKLLHGAVGATLIAIGMGLIVKGWSATSYGGGVIFLLGSGSVGSGVVVLKKGLDQ